MIRNALQVIKIALLAALVIPMSLATEGRKDQEGPKGKSVALTIEMHKDAVPLIRQILTAGKLGLGSAVHLTIGFIENVKPEQQEAITKTIEFLDSELKSQETLGNPYLFIVDRVNGNKFDTMTVVEPTLESAVKIKELNQKLAEHLATYGISLNQFTIPSAYIPHISISRTPTSDAEVTKMNELIEKTKDSIASYQLDFKFLKPRLLWPR